MKTYTPDGYVPNPNRPIPANKLKNANPNIWMHDVQHQRFSNPFLDFVVVIAIAIVGFCIVYYWL